MPNGTYGGVRGRLISPYSINIENDSRFASNENCDRKASFVQYLFKNINIFLLGTAISFVGISLQINLFDICFW